MLADEPTSMLDVSIRIGILNLMEQMKNELGVSMLYITHDIATARYVAEDLAVMYVGHMVEWGEVDEICTTRSTPTPSCSSRQCPIPRRASTPSWRVAARGDPAVDTGVLRLPVCRALQSGDAPLQGSAACHHQACRQPLRALLPLRVMVHLRPAGQPCPAMPGYGAATAP